MVAGAQIDMFSYLEDLNYQEPPVLMTTGQNVFMVVRGDVEEFVVGSRNWLVGKHNRGYDLERVGGGGSCCWNSNFGKTVFLEREDAENTAKEFIQQNKDSIICGTEMNVLNTIAYEYSYNDCIIQAFICVLDNGLMYIKEPSLYEHMETFSEKRIKKFEDGMKKHNARKIELQPELKNMYRCDHETWKYGTARYQYNIFS